MTGLLLTVVTALSASDKSVDAFFSEFVSKREHIQTITAEFVQENINPDETMRSAGRIVYVKPKQLLFEYRDPAILYAVDGLRVYQYEPDLEQVQVYEIEDSPQADAFFIAFDSDTRRLREVYDVATEEAKPGDCGARVLKLTPKTSPNSDEDGEHPYAAIYLYLNAETLLPCRIRAVDDAGAEVLINIQNYVVNDSASTPSISFRVPEGTKIVENDGERVITAGPGGLTLPQQLGSTPAPAPPSK